MIYILMLGDTTYKAAYIRREDAEAKAESLRNVDGEEDVAVSEVDTIPRQVNTVVGRGWHRWEVTPRETVLFERSVNDVHAH